MRRIQDVSLDLAVAQSLQKQYDKEAIEDFQPPLATQLNQTVSGKKVNSIVSQELELADPNPDIHQLFVEFDNTFFWGKLAASGVAVDWSVRMTLCAGVCSYEGRRSGFCSIRLSKPLLKFRPRRDLVETLLHEMIHAYLFITHNNTDHDGHGPNFVSHMKRINNMAGTRITIYHSFNQEVKQYRQHWWKCNGPCQEKHPFYGLVKRAMNRAPSPRDLWWADHQKTCGGTFRKIKEPEGYGAKKKRGKSEERADGASRRTSEKGKGKAASGSRDIRKMLGNKVGSTSSATPSEPSFIDLRTKMLDAAERRRKENEDKSRKRVQRTPPTSPRPSKRPKSSDSECIVISPPPLPPPPAPIRTSLDVVIVDGEPSQPTKLFADPTKSISPSRDSNQEDINDYRTCPVCGISNIPATIINLHVSLCLEADEQALFIDDDDT